MKSLLHPPSSIVISVALLMMSINTPTCFCDDDVQYTNCNAGFVCEPFYPDLIKYPFWGGNRYLDCSAANPQNLELTCKGGVPMIRLNEVKYRILDWDNTAQMLRVTRDDYWSDVCAVTDHYKNSTFDNTPFQRDRDQISNVTLLYNCDANPNISANLTTNCDGGARVVYTVLGPSSVSCTPTAIVVIPIMGDMVSQIGSTRVFFYGFLLLNFFGNPSSEDSDPRGILPTSSQGEDCTET